MRAFIFISCLTAATVALPIADRISGADFLSAFIDAGSSDPTCGGATKFIKPAEGSRCNNCYSSDQCMEGFCCPYMKKCVRSSREGCSGPIASCRGSTCSNADFPTKWVTCPAPAKADPPKETPTKPETEPPRPKEKPVDAVMTEPPAETDPPMSTPGYLCGGATKFIKPAEGSRCNNCYSSDQCMEGFCCPFMKKCVRSSSESCYGPTARCRGSTCENADYPKNWVACPVPPEKPTVDLPAKPTEPPVEPTEPPVEPNKAPVEPTKDLVKIVKVPIDTELTPAEFAAVKDALRKRFAALAGVSEDRCTVALEEAGAPVADLQCGEPPCDVTTDVEAGGKFTNRLIVGITDYVRPAEKAAGEASCEKAAETLKSLSTKQVTETIGSASTVQGTILTEETTKPPHFKADVNNDNAAPTTGCGFTLLVVAVLMPMFM